MELKVFRDVLPAAGADCTAKAELPLETELLISDYLPPVQRIVKCFAKPVVLQKQLQPGRLTLEGYLRADMDDNSPYSRRGKDFSTYIVCEFQDEMEGSSFVTGVTFDCRSDGSYRDTFFIYTGTLPENCFIEQGEAMEISALRRFFEAELCTGRILRYPKRVSPQHACKVERPQRAGLTDDEEGCFVPANCGYPKIHHGKHLRYSG